MNIQLQRQQHTLHINNNTNELVTGDFHYVLLNLFLYICACVCMRILAETENIYI